MSLRIAAEYLGYVYEQDFLLGIGDDDIRWQIESHPTEAELRAVELPAMRQKASDEWLAAAPGYIDSNIAPASLALLYANGWGTAVDLEKAAAALLPYVRTGRARFVATPTVQCVAVASFIHVCVHVLV